MKFSKYLILASLSIAIVSPLTAQTLPAVSEKLSTLENSLNSLSKTVNNVIPNSTSQQNVYAEAWIGKLLPSIPPHFAVGIETSVTKLDLSSLNDALTVFDMKGAVPSSFVFPTISANCKIGGLFLPFDIGFSFMTINWKDLVTSFKDIKMDYFTIGGDIRYALLKGDFLWPQVSIGAGYYYTKGSIGYQKDPAKVKLDFKSQILMANLQVSKTFLFFTPYVGFRGIFSKTDSTWLWNVNADSYALGSLTGTNTVSTNFGNSFIPQVYGGFGLKLGVFELALNGSWDFKNQIWGAALSGRLQF